MSITAQGQSRVDPLFPSSFFAKVPAEVLSPLGHSGARGMSHAEFRVFVALARFRGPTRMVNPSRETLELMSGLTPNNISRATKALQAKGWLTIHYAPGSRKRKIANYELHLPVDIGPSCNKGQARHADALGPGDDGFPHAGTHAASLTA